MEVKEMERLVQRTKDGDTQAFERLYQATSQRVYFICLSFLKNEQDASDAMQDTYLTAFKNISQLRAPSGFGAWIEQIAVNRCKNILKQNQPVPVDDDILKETLLSEDEFTIPEKYIIDKEKRRILMDIMRTKLTELQYQTIILYYFNNLSVAEIAGIMECSEGAVKNRLSKARAAIKKAIEEYQKDKDDKLFVFAGVPFLAKVFDEESKTLTAPVLNTAMLTGSAAAGTALKTGGSIMSKKLFIGILAGVVAVGGIATAVIIAANSSKTDNNTNLSVNSSENSSSSFSVSEDESKQTIIDDSDTASNAESGPINWNFKEVQMPSFDDTSYITKKSESVDDMKVTFASFAYSLNTNKIMDSIKSDFSSVYKFAEGEQDHMKGNIYEDAGNQIGHRYAKALIGYKEDDDQPESFYGSNYLSFVVEQDYTLYDNPNNYTLYLPYKDFTQDEAFEAVKKVFGEDIALFLVYSDSDSKDYRDNDKSISSYIETPKGDTRCFLERTLKYNSKEDTYSLSFSVNFEATRLITKSDLERFNYDNNGYIPFKPLVSLDGILPCDIEGSDIYDLSTFCQKFLNYSASGKKAEYLFLKGASSFMDVLNIKYDDEHWYTDYFINLSVSSDIENVRPGEQLKLGISASVKGDALGNTSFRHISLDLPVDMSADSSDEEMQKLVDTGIKEINDIFGDKTCDSINYSEADKRREKIAEFSTTATVYNNEASVNVGICTEKAEGRYGKCWITVDEYVR